jgi:putative membrane protein
MVEPLLWRPLHWCRLEVDLAGGLGHDRPEGTGAVRKALLPVGSPDEARRLLAIALPAAGGWPALSPPPRRARLKAPLSYHFLAAGHDGTLAVAVTGRVRRETTLVPLAKTQSVRLVQGPLQRWLGLATVHLDAAGKRVRAEFRERQEEQARSLVSELAALSRSARRQASPAPVNGRGAAGQAASVASPVNASQSEA